MMLFGCVTVTIAFVVVVAAASMLLFIVVVVMVLFIVLLSLLLLLFIEHQCSYIQCILCMFPQQGHVLHDRASHGPNHSSLLLLLLLLFLVIVMLVAVSCEFWVIKVFFVEGKNADVVVVVTVMHIPAPCVVARVPCQMAATVAAHYESLGSNNC
jgi:hypothetical protein